jgi:hypothetical protein
MTIQKVAQEIIADSQAMRLEYQGKFANDPDAELLAWLAVAVRREAMVSYLYDGARRENRLEGQEGSLVEAVRDVITTMWQQEFSHTHTLAARLMDGVFKKEPGRLQSLFQRIQGTADAVVIDWLTDPQADVRQLLARAVSWLGHWLKPKEVPGFALEMPAAHLGEFFLLAQALEQTARDSYLRMSELIPGIARTSGSLQPLALVKEIKDTQLDETFHHLAFAQMAKWVQANGELNPNLDAKAGMSVIRKLLIDTTGIQGVGFRGGHIQVQTDGGLGPLWKKYGLHVQVAGAKAV